MWWEKPPDRQEMGAMVTRDAVLFPVKGAKPPKKVQLHIFQLLSVCLEQATASLVS